MRKTCKRGRYRKQLRACFDYGLYWQRNIVECLIGGGETAFWFARSCPEGTNAASGDFHEIPSLQYGRKNTHDFLRSRS